MAGKGYNISIGSDTSEAEKGIRKGVIEPLEDVTKVLEDVNKDAKASGNKIEDSMHDAQKKTEDLKDEISGLSAKINEAAGSGRKFGTDMTDGVDRAKEGMSELKDESRQTAREAAASFDGSAESIVDMFQEVSANALGGFGPAGLAAGIAVAAGIGMATAEFQKNEEAAKAAKERVREFGLAVIESGRDVAGLEQFQDALKAIITDADDASEKLSDIDKFADKFKRYALDADLMAMAYAGNSDAIEMMVEQLEAAADAESDFKFQGGQQLAQQQENINALRDKADELRKVQEETQRAQEIEKAWLESGGAEAQAKSEAIQSINAAYDEAVSSASDYYNAETGLFDVSAYLAAMQARADALTRYQNSLASAGLTTEQKQALNDMGLDSAQAWMTGYEQATPAQKQSMKQFLTESASESSGEAKDVIDKTFEKPTKAKVKAEADTEQAEKDLAALITKKRTLDVQVRYVNKEGQVVG